MEKYDNIYDLISQEYSKTISDEHKEYLALWVSSSTKNQKEYKKIMTILEYSDRLKSMKNIDISKDLLLVKKKFEKRKFTPIRIKYQKIAAVLLIPLLLYSIWSFNKNFINNSSRSITKSTETSFGVRSQLELTDGTNVWLNSGSKLTYPDEFSGKIREVKLTGEAFFNVQSDIKHPFYVDMGKYKIKATGTRFNISNYKNSNESYIFLEHGKVALVGFQKSKEIQFERLSEGEMIILNQKEQTYKKQKVDGRKYLGWIDGKLIFRNDSTREVATRLGNWFNAEIIIGDDSILDYVFTATFENESLEEALQLLSYSSPISYEIISTSKLNNTKFNKRKKVIITKKKTKM